MELRELVLSTLEEMDEKIERNRKLVKNIIEKKEDLKSKQEPFVYEKPQNKQPDDDEVAFLKHTKERLEVLFEGLKSDEIKSYEQKLEITMKYLQLLLSQVDQRLEQRV